MSIMIMSRLFRMNLGGCNRKLLAVRLADFADDEGRGIYPGVKRLSNETELSERTVQRILADFVSEGILVVVQEASGRPGQATRYDFNLECLFAYKPQTGDSVTPVAEVETGDKSAETGDTGDGDGCQGDTRTVIEPLIEPPSARECAKEGSSSRNQRKEIEREFIKWMAAYDSGVPDFARNSWFAMSAEDRAECIRRSPEYIRQTVKSKRPAAAVYLKNKHWLDVADPSSGSGQVEPHRPFSRPWMALLLTELSKPIATVWPVMTAYQRMEVAKGGDAARKIENERKAKYGWPKAASMLAEPKPIVVPASIVSLSEQFVAVDPDGDLAMRWQALFERQGWPWPTCELNRLQLPAGEPEQAMTEFQSRLNEGRSNDAA